MGDVIAFPGGGHTSVEDISGRITAGISSGGGGGGGDMTEARIAKLESDVGHIQSDIGDIKTDIREIKNDQKTDFRVLFGAIIIATLGLAGLMAKGFGWLD